VAGDLVALVELGSNAVRLLVARLGPGVGFEVLEEKRVQTRLGSGRPGVLQADSIARTVAAVHQFLARARRDRDPRVIAVATAAVRDASNRSASWGRSGEGTASRSGSQRARGAARRLAVQSSLHLED
jgi:exopolyphosphatase/guanosine-5'-triphosphate,3'-diphosphate pyrophosphatase